MKGVRIHAYCDDSLVFRGHLDHFPRVGDTVRLPGDRLAKGTEIVWCWDEQSLDGQRANVRLVAMDEE